MMTLVAFCQEFRTSGTFTSWKFKFLVKIAKTRKKTKIQEIDKIMHKSTKKGHKNSQRFFYQSTQDTVPSTKFAAIQRNKYELQPNFCYPKFNSPHSFSEKQPFFRQLS